MDVVVPLFWASVSEGFTFNRTALNDTSNVVFAIAIPAFY
jgi:hypothetical protein